jgi:hypothetical protein
MEFGNNNSPEANRPPKPAPERKSKPYGRRIAAGLAAGALLTGAIEARNLLSDTPPLSISAKAFGLDKDYSDDFNIKTKEIGYITTIPLLTIKEEKKDHKVHLVDVSPKGVSEDVLSWMQYRIKPMEPILQAAFDTGTLEQIVVGTEKYPLQPDDDNSLYDGVEKTIFVDIGLSQESVSPEIWDATLMHEVGHAIFAENPISSFNQAIAKGKNAKKLQEACAAVRSYAIDDLESNISQYKKFLQKVGRLTPGYKPVIRKLLQDVTHHKLDQYYPKKKGVATTSETPSCDFLNFSQLLKRAVNKLDVSPAPLKLKSKELLAEASYIEREIIRASSIYTAFTDEGFTNDPYAGHPGDNLEESAASMFMSTMLYPEKLGENIAALPKDQGEELFTYYKSVMKEFKAVKGVNEFLDPKITIVKETAGVA